jgi:hypothetical protein
VSTVAELSGTVLDADGAPVAGAIAVAYDQRLQYVYGYTDPDGRFDLVDVPPNWYRVRILPPMADNLVEAWAGGGLLVCPSDVFDVREADAAGIDFALHPGGVVRGRLVSTEGTPVVDALLVARGTDSALNVQSRTATTDADGAWALSGLPSLDDGPSGWRVEVQVDHWPRQYLGQVYEEALGDVLEVAPGDELDVGEAVLLAGISVGGSVTGPNGPVDGGEAHVYSPSQVVDTPIDSGRYLAYGLPPGDVLSWATVDGLAMTYYPDADRPGDRVSIPDEGSVYYDLDLTLPTEALLAGRLLGGDADLGGVTVLAYNDDRTVGIGASVGSDGTFDVHQLHAGDYTLYVYAQDEGFVNDFVRDDDGDPTVFHVEAGIAERVGVELPLGAAVSGVVTDATDGAVVYGATVVAERSDGTVLRAVDTLRDGSFVVAGLPAGSWRLRVSYDAYCPADPGWAPVYYPQERDPGRGGGVDLVAGQAVTWDPVVPRDFDHDALDDAWEADNGLDPTRDDATEDPDGDGYDNLDEYHLGTDPTSPEGSESGGCGCEGGQSSLWLLGPAIARTLQLSRARRVKNE